MADDSINLLSLMEITGLDAEDAGKLLAECHGRFQIALNLQFDRLAAGKWLPPPPPPAPPIQSQAQARYSNNTQHPPSPDWDGPTNIPASDREAYRDPFSGNEDEDEDYEDMSCYPDAYLNEWPDCAIPLLNACIQNDVGKLRSMLERKDVREHISFLRAGTHKERDPDEWPLLIAAKHGHHEIARLLLEAGSPVDIPSRLGGDANTRLMIETPLACAAEECDYEMIRLLVYHGADPTRHDPEYYSPDDELESQKREDLADDNFYEQERRACMRLLRQDPRTIQRCSCAWHVHAPRHHQRYARVCAGRREGAATPPAAMRPASVDGGGPLAAAVAAANFAGAGDLLSADEQLNAPPPRELDATTLSSLPALYAPVVRTNNDDSTNGRVRDGRTIYSGAATNGGPPPQNVYNQRSMDGLLSWSMQQQQPQQQRPPQGGNELPHDANEALALGGGNPVGAALLLLEATVAAAAAEQQASKEPAAEVVEPPRVSHLSATTPTTTNLSSQQRTASNASAGGEEAAADGAACAAPSAKALGKRKVTWPEPQKHVGWNNDDDW